MPGCTVHNRLDTLDIGLPGAIGASVGVGDLDAESNSLVAELTFSHSLHLLAVLYYNATYWPLPVRRLRK